MASTRSSSFDPWAWEPARKFPAKDWLEERYRFRILTPLARLAVRPAGWAWEPARDFPVRKWMEERQDSLRA